MLSSQSDELIFTFTSLTITCLISVDVQKMRSYWVKTKHKTLVADCIDSTTYNTIKNGSETCYDVCFGDVGTNKNTGCWAGGGRDVNVKFFIGSEQDGQP